MQKNKSILFISALDFKEKSIQVIRKTPEAYVKAGWEVHYVVARDNSKYGNYFYENIINIPNVQIYRFNYPLTSLKDKIKNRYLKKILQIFEGYLLIIMLFFKAKKVLNKNRLDILYGYEIYGILTVKLLKIFTFSLSSKTISRIQGAFYVTPWLENKKYFKLILNWKIVLAYFIEPDMFIMTNDGTKGYYAIGKISPKNLKKLKFWVNGVDCQKLPDDLIKQLKNEEQTTNKLVLITISRLNVEKRIEKSIQILNHLVNKKNFSSVLLYIVGDGPEYNNLLKMVNNFNLNDYVVFKGAIPNNEVKKYLNISDIFISTFVSSNVGNPLLEAIRANKIIVTLNNGDTGSWIKHMYNGLIYDENENFIKKASEDILELINNKYLQDKIINNIKKTEKEKLWTWEERMNAEIKEVEKLLNEEN